MDIFDEIGNIYKEIDKNYSDKELQARTKGHHKKESTYSRKRQINDQAYFVFIFARLEDRIKTVTNKLIDSKVTTLTNWKTKRPWEKIKSIERLDFMSRVALLTQKGYSNYKSINDYYKIRNVIAHGGIYTDPISIPGVIADMKRFYKDLKG